METNSLIDLWISIEASARLYTCQGKYERACEFIGIWYTSLILTNSTEMAYTYINKILTVIAQHLPDEVLQAAIERGKTMDLPFTAQTILAEI